MNIKGMRGISLVRECKYSEPNRKETTMVKYQFRAKCNAAIPLSHKDFQDQHLSENYEAPKLPPVVKKHKNGKGQQKSSKLQKHKNSYA